MKKALICLCLAATTILASTGVVSDARQSTLSPRTTIPTQISTVWLRKVVGLDKQGEQGSRGGRNYAYPNSIATQIDSQMPSIVTKGFELFKSGDVSSALNIWLEQSSPLLQNNAPLMGTALQGVVKEAVGECTGYAAIDILSITDNTQVVFVESQHEYGALFWAFTTYKSPRGWIISDFHFNTDPSEVIPIPIMFRR